MALTHTQATNTSSVGVVLKYFLLCEKRLYLPATSMKNLIIFVFDKAELSPLFTFHCQNWKSFDFFCFFFPF